MGFLRFPYTGYLWGSAWRPFGPPELRYNLINGHYNIDISDRLLFCKDRNVGYDLRKNGSLDLASMYSRTNSFKEVILSASLMNGTVYQMI